MEEGTYPRGPDHVPPGLTRPTRAYRRHAYIAVAGLLVFVVLYVALTTWFAWTSYRLISTVFRANDDLALLIPGVATGFLAVFLAKALIFVRRGKPDGLTELTAAQHPKLFAFLHRLADEARAPRPRRVLVVPGVNASVFYDFSLINLIIPSRKNLVVGLGLVNVLTLGELKAVLAHEFGHFAQNTMAIGRWVYMAQQIAGHIVVKRDALDGLLRSLSGTDIRIAWFGWVLRIVVWSLRSVMDTMFGWVVLAQRALGREMELQADLVAVSLTGSDALVHALHRLEAADDAMDRVVAFAAAERGRGKAVADLFTLQTRMLERTRAIIGDPSFGVVPVLPAVPADHRLFRAKLAQPPRMWSTHPPNDVREANAKRIYIPAPLDDRSSWLLFDHSDALRAAVTAGIYDDPEPAEGETPENPDEKPVETPPIEASLAALDAELDKRYLDPCYHGTYLGRSIVRAAAKVDELYGSEPAPEAVVAALDALYPPSLAGDLARLRELSEQHALLGALQRGILEAPGGVVRHRGQEHHRREIPKLLAEVERELDEVRAALCEHDRRVRTAHLAAARAVSPGWEAYLRGLAAIHHYADHRRADLEDAAGALQNILAVVFADGRVTSSEAERVLAAAHAMFAPLRSIHEQATEVELGALAGKLEVATFKDALEPLKLPEPSEDNLGEWLDAVGGWVGDAISALSALSRFSLDELVRTEEEMARRVRAAAGGTLVEATAPADLGAAAALAPATGGQADAPAPPRPPASYPTLVPGSQRPRQLKLGWWDRFQVADGIVATAARFIVAAAIIACVVWAGRAGAVTTNAR
jgi:Zn-dependent protease with chaperone function